MVGATIKMPVCFLLQFGFVIAQNDQAGEYNDLRYSVFFSQTVVTVTITVTVTNTVYFFSMFPTQIALYDPNEVVNTIS